MALTSSMFVGSEGRERGTRVRKDEGSWIMLFYTGKASDQRGGGRHPAWGPAPTAQGTDMYGVC